MNAAVVLVFLAITFSFSPLALAADGGSTYVVGTKGFKVHLPAGWSYEKTSDVPGGQQCWFVLKEGEKIVGRFVALQYINMSYSAKSLELWLERQVGQFERMAGMTMSEVTVHDQREVASHSFSFRQVDDEKNDTRGRVKIVTFNGHSFRLLALDLRGDKADEPALERIIASFGPDEASPLYKYTSRIDRHWIEGPSGVVRFDVYGNFDQDSEDPGFFELTNHRGHAWVWVSPDEASDPEVIAAENWLKYNQEDDPDLKETGRETRELMGRECLFLRAKGVLLEYIAIGVPGNDAETGGFGIIMRLEMSKYEPRQPHVDLLMKSLALLTPEEAAREKKAYQPITKPASSPKPGDVIPPKTEKPKKQ